MSHILAARNTKFRWSTVLFRQRVWGWIRIRASANGWVSVRVARGPGRSKAIKFQGVPSVAAVRAALRTLARQLGVSFSTKAVVA